MDYPLWAEENDKYSSVEAIRRNRALGPSIKVDGVASSSSWVIKMDKMLDDTNPITEIMQWNKTSIYRVPECIKDLTNKNAYRPWLVSLGPFHHGEPDLLPMEEHKCRAVLHLVKRSKRPLADFVATIEEIADKLREAYQDIDDKWHGENSGFVEMMVTDGCFMLELMRAVPCALEGKTLEDYAPNDPVFSKHGLQNFFSLIQSDIVAIENQLPLLALERLIAVQDGTPMTTLGINKKMCELLLVQVFPGIEDNHLHALDIFHSSICGGCPKHEETNKVNIVIPTAMELREAGVIFKKSKTPWVHDMRFENGVLWIPEKIVHDATEKELLNLRVFEQLHYSAGSHVINYITTMDDLIDSERDVELLRSNGIMTNCLGSDKALADLFNNMASGVTAMQSKQLKSMLRKVNAHCSKRQNRWRAFFVRTYMRNPWVFISFVAAIILLVATLMQTIYTIVPFYTKG